MPRNVFFYIQKIVRLISLVQQPNIDFNDKKVKHELKTLNLYIRCHTFDFMLNPLFWISQLDCNQSKFYH